MRDLSGPVDKMNVPEIRVGSEDVLSADTAQTVDEGPSTSMDYQHLTLPKRPRRYKRDSMSSVDSNSSGKLSLDEERCPSETPKRTGKKRGRKPSQMNLEAKLERSRQSARECRARKKLRYQSLEDTIAEKESKVYKLRKEVHKVCIAALQRELDWQHEHICYSKLIKQIILNHAIYKV